ncbi:MAG: hypothetical protein OIF57_03035 [Marinobacterium sp.]|nr:hypothetical protein [Marinobacterium sp.]
MTTDISRVTRSIEQQFMAIEQQFMAIEQQILSAETFAAWHGSFEIKKVIVSKEGADNKCDLDVRLLHWPEGVVIKLYKHKALAVLPCVEDETVVRQYLGREPVPCKFWKDRYYFSHRTDLDDGRYVLRDGNAMTLSDGDRCLEMLKEFIVEIEDILAAART